LNVAIAGSSGFVGAALVNYLEKEEVKVVRLVRSQYSVNRTGTHDGGITQVSWNPDADYVDLDALDSASVDAIVNLAGENVHQRWTESTKRRLIASRLRTTNLLGKTIPRLKKRPRVFISASGISYYHNIGIRGPAMEKDGNPDHNLGMIGESGNPGSGFLSELCQEWERASELGVGEKTGVRTVNLRIGIALGPTGGVMKKILPIFRMGLGGKWGDGMQYLSWIGIDDLARIIHFAIITESIVGPLNAVAPNPVTNLEFVNTLGRVLSRPVVLTVPAWLVRMMFGKEWVESTLLADCRIKPAVLIEKGFKFQDPELEPFFIKKLT
jgi:uncharacterized protein